MFSLTCMYIISFSLYFFYVFLYFFGPLSIFVYCVFFVIDLFLFFLFFLFKQKKKKVHCPAGGPL